MENLRGLLLCHSQGYFFFSALEEPYEKFKCAIKSSSMGVLCTAFPDVESLDQILGNAVHKNSTLESLIGQCDFS